MRKAVVYTSPTCHACHSAIALLKQLDVEVEEREGLFPGVPALPVVIIDGRIIVGYSPEEIKKALDEADGT